MEQLGGALPGHDHPEQEGAEDGMDADLGGDVRRGQEADHDDGEDVGREPANLAVALDELLQAGPHHLEHEGHEDEGLGQDDRHVQRAGRGDDGEDERQQRPGQDVVDGGTGEGEGADLGAVHAPLGEDAGQDGEGGHRHGGPDEQGKGQERHRLAVDDPVAAVQQDGEQAAQCEGQRHRRDRDHRRQPLLAADELGVELEADDEHEDHQAELGHHLEEGANLGREQQLRQVARESAQQAGPEHDAGEDLAHHRRLADAAEQRPHQPGHDDDDGDVDQHDRGDLTGAHCRQHHDHPLRRSASNVRWPGDGTLIDTGKVQ